MVVLEKLEQKIVIKDLEQNFRFKFIRQNKTILISYDILKSSIYPTRATWYIKSITISKNEDKELYDIFDILYNKYKEFLNKNRKKFHIEGLTEEKSEKLFFKNFGEKYLQVKYPSDLGKITKAPQIGLQKYDDNIDNMYILSFHKSLNKPVESNIWINGTRIPELYNFFDEMVSSLYDLAIKKYNKDDIKKLILIK